MLAQTADVTLSWPVVAGGVLAVLSIIGIGLGALRWLWRRVGRPIAQMARDWAGEPARPGFKARPGVAERLERIEWHVGNGSPVPMRRVVEELKTKVDSYHAEEES